MQNIYYIHAHLVKGESGNPLKGEDYIVKFYDKDTDSDEFLGESGLDSKGHAIVPVSESDFNKDDEKFPDIFITVQKDGEEIYTSPVNNDVHLEEESAYPASGDHHFDLGIFKV